MTQSETISARALIGLRACSVSNSVDLDAIIRKIGLPTQPSIDPDAMIDFKAFCRLLETAAITSQDSTFGFKFGVQFARIPSALGLYYYVVVTSATIREALVRSARFLKLVTNAYTIEMEESEGVFYYKWNFSCPDTDQFNDALIGLLVERIRFMTQPDWLPYCVEFKHSAPARLDEYTGLLGPNLVFGCQVARVGIQSSVLNQASPMHDPFLNKEVERLATKLFGVVSTRSSFVERVADAIVRSLANGEVKETQIAAMLTVSVRELQRDLAAAGTTFLRLREEVRIEAAKRFLEESNLQLTEIAYLLGFSELSAFSRVAKAWFGVTPSKYRQDSRPSVEGRQGKTIDSDR